MILSNICLFFRFMQHPGCLFRQRKTAPEKLFLKSSSDAVCYIFYINPANTEAITTVRSPATAIARLLIAPSTGPISIAFEVPIA